MDAQILLALGGLGLFLLGMLILTEGLKGLAGNALRRSLARYTTTPATGAVTGALATALIQSSSATTVTAVGLVGAGLLTFSQSLGIVFGANIGTTITGWIVAIGGFKLDLGYVALPVLLFGIMLRLFGQGRWPRIGWALVGFSLLFIGIEAMQRGMSSFEGLVTPNDFPDDSYFGRFKLVLIGAAIALVTQSSSAGVATALVALSTGAISFPQAAAMVIGMDVGTTITTALATVGGSAAMRQTGYAHVIYNTMTGVMAFFLLGPATQLIGPWAGAEAGNAQIGLVAFHTFFNTLGVLLALPLADRFANFIQDLIPERGPPLLRRLDDRLLADPDTSSDAALATIKQIMKENLSLLLALLSGTISERQMRNEVTRLSQGLDQTRSFVEKIRTDPTHSSAHMRHQAILHGIDHLNRLINRCRQRERVATISKDDRLTQVAERLKGELTGICETTDWNGRAKRFGRLRSMLRGQRRSLRARIIEAASEENEMPERTLAKLDGLRWLHRVSYHIWRILQHLEATDSLDGGEDKTAAT